MVEGENCFPGEKEERSPSNGAGASAAPASPEYTHHQPLMKRWAPLCFDEKGGEHIGVGITVLRIRLVQTTVVWGISVFCAYSPVAASRRNVASAQEVVS